MNANRHHANRPTAITSADRERARIIAARLANARKVQTLADLLARLPFLFTVAAVAFVALAGVAVGVAQ